jgi:hypothetical protein
MSAKAPTLADQLRELADIASVPGPVGKGPRDNDVETPGRAALLAIYEHPDYPSSVAVDFGGNVRNVAGHAARQPPAWTEAKPTTLAERRLVQAAGAVHGVMQGTDDRRHEAANTLRSVAAQIEAAEWDDWISSSEVKDKTGLKPDTIAIRAKRGGWEVRSRNGLAWYRRSDIREAWPEHRDFIDDSGLQRPTRTDK